MLIRHEGTRLKPYIDSVGKITIGFGTNLEDGITREEALWLMRSRVATIEREMISRFPVYKTLDPVRQYVLLDMAYNMGVPTLAKFKRMWAALEDGNYDLASEEMLNSRWAWQVGSRARELARMMASGKEHP